MEKLKMKLEKAVALFAVAVTALVIGMGAFVGTAKAVQNIDPTADFGLLRGMLNGVVRWIVTVNSTGQLDIYENTTTGALALRVDNTDLSLKIRSQTSAQIGTLAPTAAGELIVNSSENVLCISTGTGLGAWVTMSTGTAAGGAVASKGARGICN